MKEHDEREIAHSDLSITQLISKAEIDQQIATAKQYPRGIKRFIQTAIELATLDEDTAEDCIYALPRTEKDPITGKTVKKTIEGPSARLAEICHHAWGNCIAGARVLDDRGEFITAQGIFHDLETNSKVSFEVRRRITTKRGDRYSADMIAVTGNAAASIALRNAVFKGIPKAFWGKIYEAARQVVAGDSQTLVNRRGKAIAHMQKLGVTVEMIVETLGVESLEDIGLDHLVTLRGIATAIKESETTVEEAFGKKDAQPNGGDDKKNKNAPAPGSTTAKAKSALKGGDKADKDAPDAQALATLRATSDKAGIAENALLEKYLVESLDVMTRDQYQDAMRYVAGVIASNEPPQS